MKTLKVYGWSDDNIETEGIEGCDEFGAYAHGAYRGYLLVTDGNESIRIHAIYDGSWGFAVVSTDEDSDYEHLPDWPIRRSFGKDVGYSETLEIDVPDNTRLERYRK